MAASANISAAEVEGGAQLTAERARPAGVRSPTVLALHSAGWLLLLCLFLPVCRSCGGPVVRPVETLALPSPARILDVLWCVITLSVYGNGVLVASVVTVSACLRSRNVWWRGFVAQLGATLALSTTFLVLALWNVSTSRDFIEGALAVWLPLGASLAWIAVALRRGESERAWARLQHVWNVGAWLELHLFCLFHTELFFGYWVTLLAIVAQFCAVELATRRLHHDLWDASHPAERPQFSLRRIFLWTTLPPLIFAYYQAINPVIDWLLEAK